MGVVQVRPAWSCPLSKTRMAACQAAISLNIVGQILLYAPHISGPLCSDCQGEKQGEHAPAKTAQAATNMARKTPQSAGLPPLAARKQLFGE